MSLGGGYLSFYLISFYFVSFYVRTSAEDSARSRQVGEGHSVETLPLFTLLTQAGRPPLLLEKGGALHPPRKGAPMTSQTQLERPFPHGALAGRTSMYNACVCSPTLLRTGKHPFMEVSKRPNSPSGV